jgi:chromosome segregation ATPase
MKMVEINLRSLANDMNKLLEKKARTEKKLEKATAKVEKLNCKWTWEEHKAFLDNAPRNDIWLADKDDIKKNGAWFDWTRAQDDLKEIIGRIERMQNKIEKAEEKVDEYHAEVEKIEDAKKREELWKLEFEQEQKEWAKDGIKLNRRYAGETPSGKKFEIYGNQGFTNRSRHCFTLYINGNTVFTSGEFWRCYMIIKQG